MKGNRHENREERTKRKKVKWQEDANIVNEHSNGGGVTDGELGLGLADTRHHPEIGVEVDGDIVVKPDQLEDKNVILLLGP